MSSPSLDVLYEDEWIIAVNKEAGQLVHAADDPKPDDVVVMKLVRDLTGVKIYPTHRLDRPTCGVLLFAKGRTAARALNRSFERKQVDKTYRAIIIGQPKQPTWTCSEPLRKQKDMPLKDASTDFRVLERLAQNLTLIEAIPHTGRYHQIRKHLLHSSFPIVGDYFYAGIETCDTWGEKLGIGSRMMLQCCRMKFLHPMTKEETLIKAPEDACFQKIRLAHSP